MLQSHYKSWHLHLPEKFLFSILKLIVSLITILTNTEVHFFYPRIPRSFKTQLNFVLLVCTVNVTLLFLFVIIFPILQSSQVTRLSNSSLNPYSDNPSKFSSQRFLLNEIKSLTLISIPLSQPGYIGTQCEGT